MDPFQTNRLDPALRVIDKHSGDYEPPPRRRRPVAPPKPTDKEKNDAPEPTEHKIDDLA